MPRRILRLPVKPSEKPDDEREIEDDARAAIAKSKAQINRARDILADEVRRLDSILSRG